MNKTLTVLVVDDEEDLKDSLQYLLQKRGFNVLTAGNGAEGYRLAQENKVDAIVSDVRMPTMDGVELLKKIKATFPDLPVVFLITGFADISEEEATRLGAAGLVHKPFNTDQIVQEITRAVSETLKLTLQPAG